MMERRPARLPCGPTLSSRVKSILGGGSIFTADRYTVDGVSGKVAGFVDHLDETHALAQATSAVQVAVPAESSLLGGKLAAAFLGAQQYYSTRAASAWRHLHDGTGFSLLAVFDPRGVLLANTPYCVAGTGSYFSNFTGNCFGWRTANPTPAVIMRSHDSATQPLNVQSNTLATSYEAIGTYLHYSYSEASSPEYSIYEKGNLETSGASLAAPNTGDPAFTFTLGAAGSPTSFAIMNWGALLVAPRVWSACEVAAIRGWVLSTYGISP